MASIPSFTLVSTDLRSGSATSDGHFDSQKRTEVVAARHVSLPENMSKCFCSRASAQDPTGEDHSVPRTL